MTNVYVADVNVDILSGPHGRRITFAKGSRFSTSDPAVQRFLSRYPHVELLSSEPDAPTPRAGGEAAGSQPPVPSEVEVRTYVGLQLKEKRPMGGRVADADR